MLHQIDRYSLFLVFTIIDLCSLLSLFNTIDLCPLFFLFNMSSPFIPLLTVLPVQQLLPHPFSAHCSPTSTVTPQFHLLITQTLCSPLLFIKITISFEPNIFRNISFCSTRIFFVYFLSFLSMLTIIFYNRKSIGRFLC